MKINPYLYFNGDAAKAIALYEKAFGGKALVLKYRDMGNFDSSYAVPEGLEDCVAHANMNLGEDMIMFCDVPKNAPHSFSNGVQLMVSLFSKDEVLRVFDVFAGGGEVIMPPQKTFWSDCFASIKDKFGIFWLLSYENSTQKETKYGE